MPDGKKPFYHDAPLDRMLRLVVDRDMASYPADQYVKHAALLGKPIPQPEPDLVIVDFTGGAAIWGPRPSPSRRCAIFFEDDPLWATSQ